MTDGKESPRPFTDRMIREHGYVLVSPDTFKLGPSLRELVSDPGSWRGGYELTDEAGEKLFRLLGLEPRCLGKL